MINAVSVKNHVVLQLPANPVRLERSFMNEPWQVFSHNKWLNASNNLVNPTSVHGFFTDYEVTEGIYQYRACPFKTPNLYTYNRYKQSKEIEWDYSTWVRCGVTDPFGYTFGNYSVPEGQWGDVLTPDDIHYTYLWGVDFRASNGQPYTDHQTQFFINAAVAEVARRLNITIHQTRIVCNPESRHLKVNVDYDEEESYYTYKPERIQRQGMISTRKRPVQKITRLDLMMANQPVMNLLDKSDLDKTKGLIRFFMRPRKADQTTRAIMQSIYPYGEEQWAEGWLRYAIDYVAGYKNSDDVPADLRAVIGKVCAVEMLNIIGDGLMAGFSSSSLSMDGVSESFSSTQSATSATYGARIKEYNDEIQEYMKANRMKFGHFVLGAL